MGPARCDSGCRARGAVQILASTESRLLAPVPDANGVCGKAIAACGDILVVGARNDDLFATSGGAAYVYRLQNGVVTFVQTLLPPVEDRNPNWWFGVDVDVVCGWTIDFIAVAFEPDYLTEIGGAYIFERTGPEAWELVYKFVPAFADTHDDCGLSVALDAAILPLTGGDELVYQGVLGCPRTSRYAEIFGGAAYYFRRLSRYDWGGGYRIVQDETIVPGDQHSSELFGMSVDLSGGWVVVGTPLDDNGRGAVHVFTGTAARTKLVPSTLTPDAHFGQSVSIDPWHLAAGAWLEDEPVNDAGAVYVYFLWGSIDLISSKVVTAFDHRLAVPGAGADDQLGYAVRVETPYILASLDGHDVGAAGGAGAVALFALQEINQWRLAGIVEPQTAVTGGEGAGFGGVAMSGSMIYGGAPGDDMLGPSGFTWPDVGSVFAWDVEALRLLFGDGFESGDLAAWSALSP